MDDLRAEEADIEPDRTLGDRYPGLRPVASWQLQGHELEPMRDTHEARLEFEWLRRNEITTIDDLLGLTKADLHNWRGFGATKVDRILGLVARLDASATGLLAAQLASASTALEREPTARLFLGESSADLLALVEWAHFSAGAVTLRDALACLGAPGAPADIAQAVDEALSLSVPVVDVDPLADLRSWLGILDDREAAIVARRLIRFDEATLDDLGGEFGVTRERIRQIESKIKLRLDEWVSSAAGRSVRWAIHLLNEGLGACAPDTELPLVGDDGGHSAEFGLLLFMADMVWDRENGVVHRRDFRWPRPSDVPTLEGGPLVDEPELIALLSGRGVRDGLIAWAIDSLHSLRRLEGVLVQWPGNLVEQAIAVLTRWGVPMTDEQIAARLDRDFSIRGLRDRLFQDPRIVRVTKDDFALASWGLPEYGGIVTSMVARIEEVGPTPLQELAAYLSERHAIKPGSVSSYSNAPVFVTEDGVTRLRRIDEPYIPKLSPSSVHGLFVLESGARLAWHVKVDREVLRGSGRLCPAEIATAFGVFPGRSVTLSNPVRDITIGWIATTHMGPTISSLRALAEAAGATQGGCLRLIFDRGSHTVTAERFDSGAGVDGQTLLGKVLDLPASEVTHRALADAVSCEPVALTDVLRRRGDVEVADAAASLDRSP